MTVVFDFMPPGQVHVAQFILEHLDAIEGGHGVRQASDSTYEPSESVLEHVNLCDKAGQTALHYACRIDNPELVHFLIERKARVNEHDEHNRTPLHIATRQKRHANLEILLQCPVDINNADKGGLTALGLATRIKDKVSIDLLTKAGASKLCSEQDGGDSEKEINSD
jgi:ankyrin repeat protein